MEKNIYHKGSCYCGAVKYSIIDHPLFTHSYHCKDCKKSTGCAFVIHTMTLENTLLIIMLVYGIALIAAMKAIL